jgi:hypothetical protein
MKRLSLVAALALAALLVSPARAQTAGGIPETVDQLKERIIEKENAGKLGFRQFTLYTKIEGFGQIEPAANAKVKGGTKLQFYYEPQDLFTKRADGSYQKWFTQDMIVRDANGKELLRKETALDFNYKTRTPVFDVYGTNSLSLGELPPGDYEFEAVVHDQLSKQEARYVFKFEIVK